MNYMLINKTCKDFWLKQYKSPIEGYRTGGVGGLLISIESWNFWKTRQIHIFWTTFWNTCLAKINLFFKHCRTLIFATNIIKCLEKVEKLIFQKDRRTPTENAGNRQSSDQYMKLFDVYFFDLFIISTKGTKGKSCKLFKFPRLIDENRDFSKIGVKIDHFREENFQ